MSEIGNFDHWRRANRANQYIQVLHVSVNNASLVNVREPLGDLGDNLTGIVLRELFHS